MAHFYKESIIEASVEDVFAFHERPDAFELLQPPWDKVEIITPPTSLEVGTKVSLFTWVGPFKQRIEAEHVGYEKNVFFEDVMHEGPFKMWRHRHLFFPHERGCRLRDDIQYEPPMGFLGTLADPIVVRPRLVKMFDFRHEVTRKHVLSNTGS